MDLIAIRMELAGAREAAAEAKLVSTEIASTGRASTVAGTAAAGAEKKTSRYQRSVSALGRAARVSGLALAGGLAVGAYKSVGAAVDLEEQINKTSVVFGASSRGIIKWSENTATQLGLSQESALEYAGTFGNMLRPMGFAEKESAKISQRLVDLSADMASFNNSTPEEALEALRSGLTGESEPLRRFGVMLSDTALQGVLAKQGIEGSTAAVDEQTKTLGRLALIEKGTALAQGDRAATADSLANSTRTLTAQLTDLGAGIGAHLIPPLEDAAGWLTDLGAIMTDPKLSSDEKWNRIGEKISDVLGKGLDAAARVAPKIAGTLIRGFLNANGWVKLAGGLWLAKVLGGGKLLGVAGKAGGAAGVSFGKDLAKSAFLWLIGTSVGSSLVGAFLPGGKVRTAVTSAASKAGGVAGRAFAVGFVTLGAAYIARELQPAIANAASKVFGGTAEENSNLLESLTGADPFEGFRNSIGLGGATGGLIPGGYGGGDRVPLMTEPGEYLLRKEVVRDLGLGNLASLNSGGPIAVPSAAPKQDRRPIHTHVHLNRREIALAVHDEVISAAALT